MPPLRAWYLSGRQSRSVYASIKYSEWRGRPGETWKNKQERKRLKRRRIWNLPQHLSGFVYQLHFFCVWERNKLKIKETVVSAVFWNTAGGVQSIKSAPWLLKKWVNWRFSVQLGEERHEMMETAQTDHKYISISLSPPTQPPSSSPLVLMYIWMYFKLGWEGMSDCG